MMHREYARAERQESGPKLLAVGMAGGGTVRRRIITANRHFVFTTTLPELSKLTTLDGDVAPAKDSVHGLTKSINILEVYCHAIVRNADGCKMSKSLGNVVDPLDVIQGIELEALHAKLYEGNLDEGEIKTAKKEQAKSFQKGIPPCGTDALRFALCAYSDRGRDINLEVLRVEEYRKFCNKIFNATKFAMLKLGDMFVPEATPKPSGNESLVEKWILHKLNLAADIVNKQLTERNFMNATSVVYNFWLYELCDVYIEAMKPMMDASELQAARRSSQQTLYTCLNTGLRLLHPFMPFITEEL